MRGLCLIAVLLAMEHLQGANAQAGLPPAYLPLLSVQGLTPQAPATKPAGGYLQLTPKGCTTKCIGFQISNAEDFASKVNTAVFTPTNKEIMVDPMGTAMYEIGTLSLTNKGFMQPMGAGMTLVPLKGAVTVATPTVNKPTKLNIEFQTMWSLGSPAPPNQAGIFALATKNPAPSYDFKVWMTSDIVFSMNLKLIGFAADPKLGSGIEVLGDWGQSKPASGAAGPRVYVKEGQTQVVKLYACISNTGNPNKVACT